MNIIKPLIILGDLPFHHKQILNNIYKEIFYKEIDEFKTFYFFNNLNHQYIINSIKWEQIEFLNNNNIIYYFFTSKIHDTIEFKKKLIHHQISNVIFLSEPQNWILPNIEIKKKSKWIIFLLNHPYRLFYKNIATLGGYNTIFFNDDISTINFIIEHHLKMDELILFLDLDFFFDFEKFLYELNQKIYQYSYISKILKILCLKDLEKNFRFSLQNFVIFKNKLANLPPIKKIFSPEEGILLLLEAFILFKKEFKEQIYYYNINSLNELLYNDYPIDYLINKKHFILDTFHLNLDYYKKILPLLWMYDYFKSISKETKTLILK